MGTCGLVYTAAPRAQCIRSPLSVLTLCFRLLLMGQVVGASEADRAATVQKVSEDLMKINLQRAHANFGNSADNMTAIMMYFIKS